MLFDLRWYCKLQNNNYRYRRRRWTKSNNGLSAIAPWVRWIKAMSVGHWEKKKASPCLMSCHHQLQEEHAAAKNGKLVKMMTDHEIVIEELQWLSYVINKPIQKQSNIMSCCSIEKISWDGIWRLFLSASVESWTNNQTSCCSKPPVTTLAYFATNVYPCWLFSKLKYAGRVLAVLPMRKTTPHGHVDESHALLRHQINSHAAGVHFWLAFSMWKLTEVRGAGTDLGKVFN